jgi:hypothetical protein
MLHNLPAVPKFKLKCNLNELQVLHFMQNYGYIIQNQQLSITASSKNYTLYISTKSWWADFIAACSKINIAYKQANEKRSNASIVLGYSEAAALYKVIMLTSWDQEDSYAQIVVYSFIEKLHKYLC